MTEISVRNLWMEYGDQIVLERIDFDVAPHAFVSLVGPSGCGKSTFLRKSSLMVKNCHLTQNLIVALSFRNTPSFRI